MKKFLITSMLATVVFVTGVTLMPNSVAAQTPATCNNANKSSFLGFPTWYKYLKVSGTATNCDVELPIKDGKTDIGASASLILLAVFEIMLRVSGIAAVALVMWGGIKYQLSQGSPEEANKARSTITNALIGLALTVSATVIVNLIGRGIG